LNFGNDLQPNALSALEFLGLLDQVKSLGAIHYCWFADKEGGSNFACWDYRILHHSHPYAVCIRPHLLRSLLRNAVARIASVDMLIPAEFVSLEKCNGFHKVTIRKDERCHVLRSRLVVGSDGAHSRVRSSTGIGCDLYRYPYGWVDTILPRSNGDIVEGHVALGCGEYLGVVPTRAGELVVFHLTSALSQEKYQADMGSIQDLRKHYLGLAPSLQHSISALQSWDQARYMPSLRVRAHTWVADGIALAGDAALSVNPITSQGAGLALEGGVRLAAIVKRCFERGDLSRRALLPYEAWSRPEAEAIQELGDLSLRVFSSRNPLVCRIKEQMFRQAGTNVGLRREVLAYSCGLHWLCPQFRSWHNKLRHLKLGL